MNRCKPVIGISVLALLLFFTSDFAIAGNRSRPDLATNTKASGTKTEKKAFSLSIDVAQDMLSAKIKKAPLEAVLEELKQKTDLTIEVNGSLADETISVEFDPLPLEKGLHTLFRNKSYILTYTKVIPEDGSAPQFRVEGIKVAGKSTMPPLSPFDEERVRREWPQESFRQYAEETPDPTINEADNAAIEEDQPTSSPGFPLRGGTLTTPRNVNPPNVSVVPPTTHTTPPANTEETETSEVSNQEEEEEEPSIDTLKTRAISSADVDIRMDAMSELADRTGLDAISILRQAATSDPDSYVRGYAQDLIQQVQDDASDADSGEE